MPEVAAVFIGRARMSREKSPVGFVMYVRLSACITAARTGKNFREVWYLGDFHENLSPCFKFSQGRTKLSDTLNENPSSCWRHKFAINHFCATMNIFVLFSVTCNLKIHHKPLLVM